MNEPLARFLLTLAGDVHRNDQFNGGDYDRQAFFHASGLTAEDQEAILSGDADRIYDALQGPIEIHTAKKPAVKRPGVKKPGVKSPGVRKPPVKSPKAPAVKKP